MFDLVTLLKYIQTTIAINNRATWLHGRFRELIKAIYLETLTRSLSKLRNDRDKN